jgi:dephospho-CoA kinase
MAIVILTGASGAGKTAVATRVAIDDRIRVHHFDTIGVPSHQEMVRECGSLEAWQLTATRTWMRRLALESEQHPHLLLEGQMRQSFIASAASVKYRTVLIDCDNATRAKRLTERGQGGLANDATMKWASWLRAEAHDLGTEILDTTNLTVDEVAIHIGGRFATP